MYGLRARLHMWRKYMSDILKKYYFCKNIQLKMRKILFYIIALTSVVSCLNGTSYSSSYQVLATFDYGDAKFRSDSTFYVSAENIGIGWNYLAFCHKVDASGDFLGGFRLSCLEGQIKENAEETAPQAEGEALPLDMTWRVNTVPEANNYMVFWDSGDMPESHILFMNPTNGKCTMALCYVCNTAKVAEEIKSKPISNRNTKLINIILYERCSTYRTAGYRSSRPKHGFLPPLLILCVVIILPVFTGIFIQLLPCSAHLVDFLSKLCLHLFGSIDICFFSIFIDFFPFCTHLSKLLLKAFLYLLHSFQYFVFCFFFLL